MVMTTMAERIAAVRSRIHSAARAAGRDPSSIELVGVSKFHPAELVREAYAAGLRKFGENYAQELVAKAGALSDLPAIEWHMIGHLQGNKARLVAPLVHAVQTVDSAKLAEELGKRVAACGRRIDVLVEVTIAGESTKSGCIPAELAAVIAAVRAQPALRLSGLMAMPPFDDDPETTRPYFAALRALRDEHGGAEALPELSMGMSHDLEVAVAEGATVVRVGTAIFGERPT